MLFAFESATIVVGWVIHVLVERGRGRLTGYRAAQLALLWVVVLGGFWNALGGVGHIAPGHDQIADEIGFAHSPFQWEVGWGDIAVGVLGMLCFFRRNRGGWLNASVIVLIISFWGDGIGHIVQLAAHHDTAPDNVWSMPTDFLQPLAAVLLLVGTRHHERVRGIDPMAARARRGGEPTDREPTGQPS